MRTLLLRRLPWIAVLLAACGDDAQQLPDETSSSSVDTSTSSTGVYSDTGIDFTDSGSSSSESSGSESSGSEAVDSSESSSTGAPNLGPTAVDDEFFARQGEVLDTGGSSVLDNDVDPESDLLVVTAFDAVSANGGTVDVDVSGGFVYTPAPGFFGVDTFGYTASDETSPAMGRVTVHVAPVRAQLEDVEAGVGGFFVDGSGTIAGLGRAVAGMGDLDGDGLADILIGAPYGRDPAGVDAAGRSYVVFGKADHDTITVAELEAGSGGFAILGDFDSYNSGWTVANAGDVDGDGLADILLGDPYASARGRVHLVFGKADTALVELADVDEGIGGFLMQGMETGIDSYTRAGRGVAGVGDLDADGYDDFAVGTPGSDRAQVVFGGPELGAMDLGEVGAGVRGFVLEGDGELDSLGYALAGIGDVDGDGIGDIAVGAPGEYDDVMGRCYVVFGKTDEAPVSLADLADDGTGFVMFGAPIGNAGGAISGIGDLDGDGRGDLVIGDSTVEPARAYVVLGRSATTPLDLTQLGDAGFAIEAEGSEDALGYSVAGAGDINGDGLADLVVGAPMADSNGEDAGSAYVVYGASTLTDIELADVALGDGGFAIDGVMADDHAGVAVGGAGDVDGDGLADVVVGASWAADVGGRAYVVFGVRTAPP